jgi:hypothetical protein
VPPSRWLVIACWTVLASGLISSSELGERLFAEDPQPEKVQQGQIQQDQIQLSKECRVVFATPKQATKHLRAKDQFVSAMSVFDRQSRVGKSVDVSESDYLDFLSAHVLEWEQAEKLQVALALASLAKKLAPYDLPLPGEILMIKTSGGEEGNAAYCRSNAIVLPKKMVKWQGIKLERLLTHELFHVLSSHNAELRTKMYKIIGFTTVEPMGLPKSLVDRKITNPDAPQLDSVIQLETEKGDVFATPFLFAKRDYDDSRNDSFFAYMTFRLLVVKKNDGNWFPVSDDGQPQLLDPAKTPSYGKQIGSNTGYIIHPDEIMADNFVHLVQRSKDLETPRIVEELRALLSSAEK